MIIWSTFELCSESIFAYGFLMGGGGGGGGGGGDSNKEL